MNEFELISEAFFCDEYAFGKSLAAIKPIIRNETYLEVINAMERVKDGVDEELFDDIPIKKKVDLIQIHSRFITNGMANGRIKEMKKTGDVDYINIYKNMIS